MKRFLYLVTLIFILFVSAECEWPFSTRDPEPPVNNQSAWVIPVSPEMVLSNLQRSVKEKSVEYYIRCLTDSSYSSKNFKFLPDPEISAQYTGIFINWTKQKEESVMRQVFSIVPDDSTCSLDFVLSSEAVASESAILVVDYTLRIRHTGTVLKTKIFKGRSEFWLAPDVRGEWSIYNWIDHRTSDREPWSLLKAKLGG
ncbi:hypothetical protein J7K93_12195 [bacterium]|nr:hypothetical protein [bacterium]